MTRLWLRADARPGVGLGHTMRLLALDEVASSRGIPTTMVMDDPDPAERAPAGARDVVDVDGDWFDHVRADDIVVFDGYEFGHGQVAAARAAGAVVAMFDDVAERDLAVDVVINQSVVPSRDRHASIYSRAGVALLGPSYAMVRREFMSYRRPRGNTLTSLVITLGGGATPPVVQDVIEALASVDRPPDVRLVKGPGAHSVPNAPWLDVHVRPAVVAAAFDADAAISAAGITTWELLAMGVPTLLVQTADNQEHVIRTAVAAGAALSAGPADATVGRRLRDGLSSLHHAQVRRDLSVAALALVDGQGPDRVLGELVRVAEQRGPC